MNATEALFHQPAAQAVGWALLHFVWQGALIGLAAFVLLRVVRPADAAVRYVIGLGALATMLAPAAYLESARAAGALLPDSPALR